MTYGAEPSDRISHPLSSPGDWTFRSRHTGTSATVQAKTYFEARKLAAIKIGAGLHELDLTGSPF